MRVLLTLGRLPKALELARALARAGADVVIAEPFGAHLCKPSHAVAKTVRLPAPARDQALYLDELLSVVAGEQIECVIPVSEEALHVSLLAERLPEGVRLFGPGHAQLKRLHDKAAFIETARALGLPAPETFPSGSAQAAAFAAHTDYILKPTHACSGQGLRLRTAGDPLTAQDTAPGQILQRRIYGRHVSSQTIAENGRVLGTVLYEATILSGTVAVGFRRVDDAPAVEAWIERFVAAERYSGFIAFDFIVDEAGPWPLECNPRLTSGLHFFDPVDLAAAVLGPAPAALRLKPQAEFVEWHTAMLEAYAALPDISGFWRRLSVIRKAKDVLLQPGDPWPFFLMTPMSWPVLSQVLLQGRSFGEAATRDIAWVEPAASEPVLSEDGAHAL